MPKICFGLFRNLALRVGLPVHVTLKRGDKSSAEKNSEAGEDVQDVDNVVDDVSDIVQSEGDSSAHSDLEIDEELSSVHEKHGNEQDQHQEHYFLDQQTVEAKSPSPTSSVRASSSGDDTESRPSRMRRAPRRFVDD
ncbi:hypothetical protein TELCIR_18846 [Teladorsagia circumcincta]|uniref:Uncharacterized protein n=1 Tax=Teladorsagia circumcincta TaxID=45464 RepID=A0A2G9TQE0_TELCI|nr:hypothetical protein TELCIR_18846 [Teladorsagia circumcincta]